MKKKKIKIRNQYLISEKKNPPLLLTKKDELRVKFYFWAK